MSAEILRQFKLTPEIVARFSKQWEPRIVEPSSKLLKQRLLMRRLRAERKGKSVDLFPKRERLKKGTKPKIIVPNIGQPTQAVCTVCAATFWHPWKGMRQRLCPEHTCKTDLKRREKYLTPSQTH